MVNVDVILQHIMKNQSKINSNIALLAKTIWEQKLEIINLKDELKEKEDDS